MNRSQDGPARWRALARVGLWVLAGLVLFEAAWLALFGWIENSGRLQAWANRRPEKIRIEFASAASIWPGLLEVEDLRVRGRTERGLEWQVVAEQARLQIALLPLAARRLVVRGGEVRGVEVRSVSPPDSEATEAVRALRSAAVNALPPLPVARVASPPTVGSGERPRRNRWTFEFRGVRVEGVRSVVIDESELTGALRGELGFAVRTGSVEAEVYSSTLEMAGVALRHRGEQLGDDLSGRLTIELSPYRYREERGRALLPHASGRLRVQGTLDDRPILDELLQRAPWIAIQGGLAPIDVDLEVDAGRLLVGSRLDVSRLASTAQALDFTIEGASALKLRVEREGGEERARWQVGFERYTVSREGLATPLLEGEGLAFLGIASPPLLADLAQRTELRLELGRARLPDLGFVAEWLPAGARIERLAGSAEVTGTLTADVATLRPGGAVEARFDDVRLRWAGSEFAGRIEAKLAIAGGDLLARRLEVGGTRLLLADFSAPDLAAEAIAAPTRWWMQLLVDEGAVTLGPPLALALKFQTRLRDTAPLVAMFETRRNLPKWAERLLVEEDVRASGRLRATAGDLAVERLDTELLGGNLSFRLRFAGPKRSGKLLFAWRRLELGAGFDGERRELRVHDARDWFASED